MEITKNKGMSIIAVLIVFVVFNIITFVIPFIRHGGFWTGYGFAILSFILATFIGFYSFTHEGIKSKFYGLPLVSVVWTYLKVQLIVSFIEMAIPYIPFQYEIAFNSILLGACLIGLIGVNIAKEEVERIDEKIKDKVFYIKSLQGSIEGLADKTQEESLRNNLRELAEAIRYSDPMSGPQLVAIENRIEAKAASLAENIDDSNTAGILCNELHQMLGERNRKCKQFK